MRIRIFRAATLAEAMAQIRTELGPEALILTDRRRGEFVEVTAALETDEAPRGVAAQGGAAGGRTLSLRMPPDDLEPFTRPAAASAEPARPLPASSLAATLSWHGLSAELGEALQSGPLEAACARVFRFAPLDLGPGDAPLLLAGPAGSGKTLTTARLATRLVLSGLSPLVITADDKRAGAVEQLAAFTRLLGLTLVAAGTPTMLARALDRREPGQTVLIDTPGLDLENLEQLTVLQDLMGASGAASALVLPCGLDPEEATDIAGAHAALGATSLVATRTDASRRLGGVLRAAHASRLALAEAGVSSAAAEGLMPLTPGFLAERLRRGGSPAMREAAPATSLVPSERVQRSALSLHIAAQRRSASTR